VHNAQSDESRSLFRVEHAVGGEVRRDAGEDCGKDRIGNRRGVIGIAIAVATILLPMLASLL
jgi:hypothetical protein